jgi:hypothetical protein
MGSPSPALNPQAYTHGMAKLPDLIRIGRIANQPVTYQCPALGCIKTFSLRKGPLANEEKRREVQIDYEKHWKAAHSNVPTSD